MLSSNYSSTALRSQHLPPLQAAKICTKVSVIPRTAISRETSLLPLMAFHAALIGQPRCQGTQGTAAVPLLHTTSECLLDLGYMLTAFLIINEGEYTRTLHVLEVPRGWWPSWGLAVPDTLGWGAELWAADWRWFVLALVLCIEPFMSQVVVLVK